jgi:hypothetical protein
MLTCFIVLALDRTRFPNFTIHVSLYKYLQDHFPTLPRIPSDPTLTILSHTKSGLKRKRARIKKIRCDGTDGTTTL